MIDTIRSRAHKAIDYDDDDDLTADNTFDRSSRIGETPGDWRAACALPHRNRRDVYI